MKINDEQRKLNRSHFAALLVDLAKELSGPTYVDSWKVTRYNTDSAWYGEVTHEGTGHALSLSLDEYEGRVGISGIFHDRVEGRQVWYKSHNEPSPHITVAVTRSAKAVAGEVKRRLFPDYARLYAECEKRVAEYKRLVADSRQTADLIANLIGGSVRNRDGSYESEVCVYGSRDLPEHLFDVKVSGQEVTFDRLCVSRVVAEQILGVLVRNRTNIPDTDEEV